MLSAHDIALVQRKLVQMIGTAVDGLNNLDKIVPAEKGLGSSRRGCSGRSRAALGKISRTLRLGQRLRRARRDDAGGRRGNRRLRAAF